MLAFPSMLVGPAKSAGMKVPDDPESFDAIEFPHFHVFCLVQLGASLPYPTAHWNNAKVIAEIPDEEIE